MMWSVEEKKAWKEGGGERGKGEKGCGGGGDRGEGR
jgi:hypothetical protein